MRFLLPPSEMKRDGTLPGPLRLDALTAPALTPHRERALAALARRCAHPTPAVRAAIGVTAGQDAELARNARILEANVAPAHAVYDGVLYDAIGLDDMTRAQRQRVIDRVLVQSALFGLVGFGDLIPAYRCSADSTLPRLGRMGTFWRTRISDAMEQAIDGQCIVDMRSGNYAGMWSPGPALAARTVVIRVVQSVEGRRIAVSHFNKATKGRLVRALCATAADATTPDEVAHLVDAAGFETRLIPGRGAHTLEVLWQP